MSEIDQAEGGAVQKTSTDQALENINQTVSAIADLTAQRRQQHAQQELLSHQSSNWNSEQLKLLGRFLNLSDDKYSPYNSSSAPLSAQRVRELIVDGHYGGLDTLTSEMMKEDLTAKAWLDLSLRAMCDNRSYFTYDQELDILFCNIPDSACTVAFKRNTKCALHQGCVAYFEEYELYHAGMLALVILDRLECEDEVAALFSSREQFQPFFDEVLATVSLIFSQGLNNINSDMCEKIKALIVEAGSCRIEFLRSALTTVLNMLKRALDDRTATNVDGMFNLLCRIVNTVEAIRKNDSREALISLYGINSGHSYYVQTMPVLGCGSNKFDTSTPGNSSESLAYYFYDLTGRRFLGIYSIINGGFMPPQVLFSTDYHGYPLKAAAHEVLCFGGVWVSDGKIKNSKDSWMVEEAFVESEDDDSKNDKDVIKAHKELYDLIAWRDYDALSRNAFLSSSEYFSVKGRTDNMQLVHVSSCIDLDESNPEHVSAIFKDENGHKMNVFLNFSSSSARELRRYMDEWKNSADPPSDFYALLRCPVISGQMQPELVTFFGQPESPDKKKKKGK